MHLRFHQLLHITLVKVLLIVLKQKSPRSSCSWSTVSKRGIHRDNIFLFSKCSEWCLYGLCCLIQSIIRFTIAQNRILFLIITDSAISVKFNTSNNNSKCMWSRVSIKFIRNYTTSGNCKCNQMKHHHVVWKINLAFPTRVDWSRWHS